ncbi:MAG: hypothetical protein ACKVXR_07270 [Planctomycetota bacterium]
MRSRAARVCLGLLCACVLATRAAADHKDERLGFTIQTPRGWNEIPMSVDERWKVAKYLSEKSFFWTEKGGWTWEHKPNMEVVAFVADAVKEKIKVEKKETKQGEIEWRIYAENPYRDYKDFLTKRYAGGGWFVSDEKETKVGDIPVTCYEIKVEKLSLEGPKRMFTWIYHVKDVDIAVQFEMLEDGVDKLKNEVTKCLRSFKQIKRSGEALYESSTGEFRFWDQDKMTVEERTQQRRVMEKTSHEKATKTAPDGWVVKQMGRFLVLNHADEKFAKRVVEQAEAVWTWLDQTFAFVGEKEYVRSPIIRICKNDEEQQAFLQGGDWFSRNNLEIVTAQDYGGKSSWEMEYVNRRVMDIWFADKDWDLRAAMPSWLSNGLNEFVGQLHVKNGKVDFGTDYWNRDEIRERKREGKLTPLRELLMKTDREFWDDYFNLRYEGSSLVDFFVTGKASKDKRTKGLLAEYLRQVQKVAAEIKKEDEGKKGEKEKRPKTEEEEDAMFRDRQKGYKEKEKRLLEESFQRTFVGWDAGDWKKFEEAYLKSL